MPNKLTRAALVPDPPPWLTGLERECKLSQHQHLLPLVMTVPRQSGQVDTTERRTRMVDASRYVFEVSKVIIDLQNRI